jgi:type IV fimbrial biogenesis protein FimT
MKKINGVTLVELLVTVAIMAILAGVAAPSFVATVRDFAVAGHSNSMNADIRYARSEAMKRGTTVALCTSTNPLAAAPACGGTNWANGWIIFVNANNDATMDAGELLLRRQEPLGTASSGIAAVTTVGATNVGVISINKEGRVSGGPGAAAAQATLVTFLSAGTGTSQMQRFLCINANGRPKTAKLATQCP